MKRLKPIKDRPGPAPQVAYCPVCGKFFISKIAGKMHATFSTCSEKLNER